MSIREKINDDKHYGVPWAEFFISLVIAKLVQVFIWPTAWFLILLPITWLLVHVTVGNRIEKHSKGDIFGRDE